MIKKFVNNFIRLLMDIVKNDLRKELANLKTIIFKLKIKENKQIIIITMI